MPIYKKVNKNFFKTWSHSMAYVLGFIFADGNIVQTKRNTWFLSIQITDKNILLKIKQLLKAQHKISKRKLIKNNKQLYRLQIGSKEICIDLMRLEVSPNKSKVMKFPIIPSVFFPSFLRGYFDGDGHVWVGKNKKVITGFTSGSLGFLQKLKDALRGRGIKGGSIVSKARGFCLQYSMIDSLKLAEIMYNTDTQKNGLFLNRKKLIFDKIKRFMQS